MNIAVFLDTNNLYHSVRRKFGQEQKINYSALLEQIDTLGDVVHREAFGIQINRQSSRFIAYLRYHGFEPFYYNMDIQDSSKMRIPRIHMPMRMSIHLYNYLINNPSEADTVMIGTADPTFKFAIPAIKEMGFRIVVIGVGIPTDLGEEAHEVIELDETYLEKPQAVETEAEVESN